MILRSPTATASSGSPASPRTDLSCFADKLGYIDALRGLTALGIVLYHVLLVPEPDLGIYAGLKPYIFSLFSGVQCFFAISAFTLALSHHRKIDEPLHWPAFLLRRVFRIFPLYWFMLLLLCWWWLRRPTLSEWATYLTLSFNLWPRLSEGLVPASWSLSVENVFYLSIPLLLRWVRDLPQALALWLFSLALALLTSPVLNKVCALPSTGATGYGYYAFSTQLPFFAAGILAFYISIWLKQRGWSAVRQRRFAQILLGLAVLILACVAKIKMDDGYRALQLRSPAFLALLVGLALAPNRLLVNPVTRFYGKISYSLYLMHPVLVWVLLDRYMWIYQHRVGPPTLAYVQCCVLTILLVTPLAWLSYQLIERPGIWMGSWLVARLGGWSAPRLLDVGRRESAGPTRRADVGR